MDATMTQIGANKKNEEIEEEPEQAYYYQESPIKQDVLDRNVVIMIFVAFLAGLLLGKIMNPVIIRQ